LEPLQPVNRYEHQRPGELVHLDIEKLAPLRPCRPPAPRPGRGRFETGAGYEYLHVCVDDYSRLAYVELLPDERGATVAAFLERTATRFAGRGVRIERVLTDNGSGYLSRRFRDSCRRLQIRHTRTRLAGHRRTASRTLHPNAAPRMGLRTPLRQQRRTRLNTADRDQPLQLPQTTQQPQPPAARDTTEQRA